MTSQNPIYDDAPALVVLPLAEAGEGFLAKLATALAKNDINSIEQFVRMAVAARGVTVFEAGDELLVETAAFALACNAARSREALSNG